MKVRIRIREQLCLLIAITSLLALMVLALSTWFQSRHYLRQSQEQTLQVTANLKADQVAQNLRLFQDSVQFITTRDVLQAYVRSYNNGNTSQELRDALAVSVQSDNLDQAISGGSEESIYLQAAVWANDNNTGRPLITETTGSGALGRFRLPYNYPNGTAVYLGDKGAGYPAPLYPNLTYNGDNTTVMYDSLTMNSTSALFLGPMLLPVSNVTLLSLTISINNNTNQSEVLGWITVVLDARYIYEIVDSRVGLGSTGEVDIIGPDRPDNLFDQPVAGQPASEISNISVQFKLPPYQDRHPKRADNPYLPFTMQQYPAVLQAWLEESNAINNAGTMWDTHNENDASIAVGYAIVDSPSVDWVVVFGQSRGEVNAPIDSLRDTVLACIFSVFGAIIIVCFPIAHYAVKPIRSLRTATENSIMTYETYAPPSVRSDSGTEKSLLNWADGNGNGNDPEKALVRPAPRKRAKKIRTFQIPEKVPDKKHFVHDELTDLTGKFNDMSEELTVQYGKLEERVKSRTAELEQSRNEAQTANESKTLFIANVSHELRTPLNGIIGMCAVAMQEEDVRRIRQSLKIIYKSSDLLLHLLNDLLTFSRSSYGQQLAIEESTFRLVDVGTQLVSIFEKQAKDADVGLKVVFLGPTSTYPNSEDDPEDAIVARKDVAGNLRRVKSNVLARGPADVGPLREVGLRGDKNRILQILMNLVSNSLKFTPAKGQIEVRIRCRGMCDMAPPNDSFSSANTLHKPSDGSSDAVPQILIRKASEGPEKSTSQPESPAGLSTKALVFDFEVEDTGAGIPEHLQKEVFKPFVQGDLALSKKHGGTGLGLSICSQLAELMGGEIKLKSTPDIGSTFTLTLPLKYTKEQVPSVSGSLTRSGRRGSITSSVQFETFSNRSGRSRANHTVPQPRSRNPSYVAGGHERDGLELDKPRLVGFTQPFLLDNDDRDQANDAGGRTAPGFGRGEPLSHPRLEVISSIDAQEGIDPMTNILGDQTTETPGEIGDENSTSGALSPAVLTPASLTPVTSGTKIDSSVSADSRAIAPPSPSPAPAPPGASTPRPPNPRILVAEDNAVNQQVILRLLKLEKIPDADITLAEDGQFALEAVQKSLDPITSATPYTLVFMDIQMPRMDGIEATKKIRELGFEAPIVALTAFDHETNRKNCEESGMNAFLGKPIKRTALKKVLEQFKPDDT